MVSSSSRLLYILCLLSGAAETSWGKTLTWRLSTNYNRSNNWSAGRAPCSTEAVVFPADMRLAIELPRGRQAVKELVLPTDGELVLQDGTLITLTSKDIIHGSCDGGENVWLRREPGQWLDPDNWLGPSQAAPDLERVPCPTDEVIFPLESTFRVELPPFFIPVGGVYINSELLTGESWEDFQNSPEGDRQLFGGPLESTGEKCTEDAGCECPAQWLSRWICPNRACPLPNCLEPIKPLGSCCMTCGAYLLYRFSSRTKLTEVKSMVRHVLEDEVPWHVGRTMGFIQVVIKQDVDTDADMLARKLNSLLLSDLSLGLTSKSLTASGPSYRDSSAVSPGLMFFLSLVFVLAAAAVTYLYFEKGRGSWPLILGGGRRFVSARFENITGRLEIGDRPRPTPGTDPDIPRGFDNPMYSQEGEPFASSEGLLTSPDAAETESLSDDTGSSASYDRKTVTTIAIADDTSMEEVPIGKLID